ncbi:Uncharacterized protein OS=Chondromyces apiculatus DSM 436 GN=CAP_6818 PE=4 SV=1: NACHT [Gemmata massiliana]|uniref:NACHT domain-containing protein n=1 Tax=Gemmata massiliana TaxID=1210884 RepID=A0A6P2DJU2_9BACT|nr:hypothetical protein [Gemmata massiliana]VTS00740.1 Uncharacterized protein OS=Chondromyces apiculatus DSM 436 GN=CAP_6818 PE=4 SV=1: NACHT [Gemmata massiliana]
MTAPGGVNHPVGESHVTLEHVTAGQHVFAVQGDLHLTTMSAADVADTVEVQAVDPSTRVWEPAILSTLQPAQHFAGREGILDDLSKWAKRVRVQDRVVALVAVGGTGKTAVAERILRALPKNRKAGVFVWSFYEKPQTEAFLRATCDYFCGTTPVTSGGLLAHLQQGLRAAELPHLLILDGLELVQATGMTGKALGELEDPLLKQLLRWLASGHGGRARVLVTSRFPLSDLSDWEGQGYRSILLVDLEPAAARSLLQRRGVKGDDQALNALAESVHRHALTVDVLGLYLNRFGGGDPNNAPQFDLSTLKSDQKGARLTRVLESYADKLPPGERDLLARLSLFPRGVTVEYLRFIIGAGHHVAGALSDYGPVQLLGMLGDLHDLGLAFRSERQGGKHVLGPPISTRLFPLPPRHN